MSSYGRYGKKKIWEKVGTVDVDAGIIMVGDPCYSLPDSRDGRGDKGLDYSRLLEILDVRDLDRNGFATIPHGADDTKKPVTDLGRQGHGVVVSSGYGDGTYKVYVRRYPDGRIKAVKVVF